MWGRGVRGWRRGTQKVKLSHARSPFAFSGHPRLSPLPCYATQQVKDRRKELTACFSFFALSLHSPRPRLSPPSSPPQAMHTQQVEDRRQVVAVCAQCDDMYDSLAAHEQKARRVF